MRAKVCACGPNSHAYWSVHVWMRHAAVRAVCPHIVCAIHQTNRRTSESVIGCLHWCKRVYSPSFVVLASPPDFSAASLVFVNLLKFAMGGRSSKVVITPENAETAAVSGEAVAQLKPIGENGSGDAAAIDSKAEPNGECHATDTTAEALPADGSTAEIKSSQRKPGPINWIQKKISFKKAKTPKKPVTEEKPTESAKGTEPIAVDGKREEGVSAIADDVQVQSEEVPTVDQGTTVSETPEVEVTVEPVVEVVPSTEDAQKGVGEEQFVDEPEQVVEGINGADPHEEFAGEAQADLGLADKFASLGIDAVEPIANGADTCPVGDTMVTGGES
ncbi:hypothetical protein Aperf_G00000104322 [Anoplocephala perfoliata]